MRSPKERKKEKEEGGGGEGWGLKNREMSARGSSVRFVINRGWKEEGEGGKLGMLIGTLAIQDAGGGMEKTC